MTALLITVALGARRRDLAVRADVPIADLLGPLADALELAPAGDLAEASGSAWAGLALAPLCGAALPAERSLEACGIGHGAVLVLIERVGERGPAPGLPANPPPA